MACPCCRGSCHGLKDCLKLSGLQSLLDSARQHYFMIVNRHANLEEFFCFPDGEKVKVDENCVVCMPLYRDDEALKMLLLVNPQKRDSVLAVYLNEKWWGIDEILRSSGHMQDGLRQVQTCRDRIILFMLNCLVCGFVESSGSENGVCFLPHAAKELAKILWHQGEAVAFYTYKTKGSLCDQSSQCYMLPVLDTIYVRKRWRKCGFGMAMLQDFCQTFSQEAALGISFPISLGMYHVCHRFLVDNPNEQDRLWEVDPPGDWSQRMNIWLRIQLGETPVVEHPPGPILEPRVLDIPVIEEKSKQLKYKVRSTCSTDDSKEYLAFSPNNKKTSQCKGKRRKANIKKRSKRGLLKMKKNEALENIL